VPARVSCEGGAASSERARSCAGQGHFAFRPDGGGAVLVPDDLAPTHLDALPPELDADWAARVASDLLIHTECQGYRDHAFGERVL
jgi:hypothetical protein